MSGRFNLQELRAQAERAETFADELGGVGGWCGVRHMSNAYLTTDGIELGGDPAGDLSDACSPAVVLALVEAVEADIALARAEARGLDLDPKEHRELIARHDAALAPFDFGAANAKEEHA